MLGLARAALLILLCATHARSQYSASPWMGGNGGTTAGFAPGAVGGSLSSLFSSPFGVTYDVTGTTLYVADYANNRIRAVNGSASVWSVAGGGGAISTTAGYANGIGSAALFMSPVALTTLNGVLYVVDNSAVVRTITLTTGAVSAFAGGAGGTTAGFANGVGTAATFASGPYGLATDGATTLFVGDINNNAVRAIAIASATVTTLAGSTVGLVNGVGTNAKFRQPAGLAYAAGVLYVVDDGNHQVRAVTVSTAAVTSFVGGGLGTTAGFADGIGSNALFTNPLGITANAQGTILYVADTSNNRVRSVNIATKQVGTAAGGTIGYANGLGSNALFNYPGAMAVHPVTGILTVSDVHNNAVRNLTAPAPVWSFAVDSSTGLAAFTLNNGGSINFVADRNGCAGSALTLANNAWLTTTTTIPALPIGNTARSASVWVAASTGVSLLAWGGGGGNANTRSGILVNMWGVVGENNDCFLGPTQATSTWTHLAFTYSGPPSNTLITYKNGAVWQTCAAMAAHNVIASPVFIGWNGNSAWNSGEPLAPNAALQQVDDMRIFNTTLSAWDVALLATASVPCASPTPTGTPTPTTSPTTTTTQTPSFSPTPSAPPVPVWTFPVDQTTGTVGYTVVNSAGLTWLPDRNGCAGSAMGLLNSYLTSDSIVAAVPIGAAPRSASAWVKCAPTTANTVAFEWGLNVNAQRSSLTAQLTAAPINGVAFIGYSLDTGSATDSGCTGGWVWIAYSVNSTHTMVFRNGTMVAVKPLTAALATAATPMHIGWNGATSHLSGELFATTVVNALDDLRVYNIGLSPSAASQLFQISNAVKTCPSPSATPLPLSATPSPAPIPQPVWQFAVDASTGLAGWTVTVNSPGSMTWVPDRNGCANSALQVNNAYLLGTTTPPASQQPLGGSPRTTSAWLRCAPGNTAAQAIFNWGAEANNQRCGLMTYLVNGFGFVGYANDVSAATFLACNNYWTWIAASWDGTTVNLFRNGTLVASSTVTGLATTATPYAVAFNGLISHAAGELFAVNVNNSFDDIRVYNVSMNAGMAAQVYAASAGVGICPSPTATGTSTGTTTPTLTATRTSSGTGTGSWTPSNTPTFSGTGTMSLTPGASASGTAAGTVSTSWSPSGTAAASRSLSMTPSDTATSSATASLSISLSSTAESTWTNTGSALATTSSSATPESSLSRGVSPSQTATLSTGASASYTPTTVPSATSTASSSLSAGASPSPSSTAAVTASLSRGASASTTATATGSATLSSGASASSSSTASATLSTGASASRSPFPTASLSTGASPSASATPILAAAAADMVAVTSTVVPIAAGLGAAVLIAVAASAFAFARVSRRHRKQLTSVTSQVASAQAAAAAAIAAAAAASAAAAAGNNGMIVGSNPLLASHAAGGSRARLEPAAGLAAIGGAHSAGGAPRPVALVDDTVMVGSAAAPAHLRAAAAPALVRSPSLARAASFVKRAEAPLAPGWKEAQGGGSSTPYWKNEQTGMTSWSRPTVGSAEADAKSGLLPGWEAVFSKSRQVWYWRHAESEQTTWDKPKASSGGNTSASAAAVDVASAAPSSDAALPDGWSEQWSESHGAPYWYRLSNPDLTTWVRPT